MERLHDEIGAVCDCCSRPAVAFYGDAWLCGHCFRTASLLQERIAMEDPMGRPRAGELLRALHILLKSVDRD